MDNYIKVLFLIPDSMYERTVRSVGVGDLYEIFKDYKQLDALSADGPGLDSKSIFMLDTSDSFFKYVYDQLCLQSITYVRLHILDAERKKVMCLNFKQFKEMVESYTRSLQRMRIKLLRDLSDSNEELIYMKRLSKGCEALSVLKEEGQPVMDVKG